MGGGAGPGWQANDPAAAQMTMDVCRAEGALMPEIESFYLFRYSGDRFDGQERVNSGEIRFLLDGSGEMTFPGGYTEPLAPIVLAGPGSALASFRMTGPIRTFSVMLRAPAWPALIGIPAHAAGDHSMDGAALFGPEWFAVFDRLRTMEDVAAMVAAVEPLLLARRAAMPPVPYAHHRFLRIVRDWAQGDDPTIDSLYAEVAAASGLGSRQVQRLCLDYFGSAPAKLKRKFRAIRAAQKIREGRPMSEIVAPFTDQSHMINEVRHFVGHTPSIVRTSAHPALPLRLDNENFHRLPESPWRDG